MEAGSETAPPRSDDWLQGSAGATPIGAPIGEPGSATGTENATRVTTDDETPAPLSGERLTRVLEAILFAVGEGIPRKRLKKLLPEASSRDVEDALLRLEGELLAEGRAVGLVEDAGGIRLLTRSEYAPYVARLRGEMRRVRLSQAAFEALAVIAYRQPIRRADLESIRGVQCGAVIKNLLEWNLIQVVGRDENLGRALLYGTGPQFLEQFGLSGLEQLPEPDRLRALASDRGVEVDTGRDHLTPLFAEGVEPAEPSSDASHPPESPIP